MLVISVTLSMRVSADQDHSFTEVNSIKNFALKNRMKLNLKRSWEMVVHGRISKPLPPLAKGIERKCWLKLWHNFWGESIGLGPSCWQLVMQLVIQLVSSRLYILRVCKYFGYPKDQLTKLFDLLIMPRLLIRDRNLGCCLSRQISWSYWQFFKRALKFGYTNNLYVITEVIRNLNGKLWKTITENSSHPLFEPLSPKRQIVARSRA